MSMLPLLHCCQDWHQLLRQNNPLGLVVATQDLPALEFLCQQAIDSSFLEGQVFSERVLRGVVNSNWVNGWNCLLGFWSNNGLGCFSNFVEVSTPTPLLNTAAEFLWRHTHNHSTQNMEEEVGALALAALQTNNKSLFARCMPSQSVISGKLYDEIATGKLWALEHMPSSRQETYSLWMQMLHTAPSALLMELVRLRPSENVFETYARPLLNHHQLSASPNALALFETVNMIDQQAKAQGLPEKRRASGWMMEWASRLHFGGQITLEQAHVWYGRAAISNSIITVTRPLVRLCLEHDNFSPLHYLSAHHNEFYQNEFSSTVILLGVSDIERLIGAVDDATDRMLAQSEKQSPHLQSLRLRLEIGEVERKPSLAKKM